MKILVTGCAGFIGSHFVRWLLQKKYQVTGIDDCSYGSVSQISDVLKNSQFKFHQKNLLNLKEIVPFFKHQDLVIHLAANSDILKGFSKTDQDLQLNTQATYHVLEGMRIHQVRKIIFASSSAVYGEPEKIPTAENYAPLKPISLYGASKLACEGFIAAYSHLFEIQSWVYRFGNVVGGNPTHGVIYDFIHKLKKDSSELQVLGNGMQKKSYIHVKDCIEGIGWGFQHAKEKVNIFNLSSSDQISVKEIAELTKKYFGTEKTKLQFQKQSYGWKGDVVQMHLNTAKMKKLGWKATLSSRQAIAATLTELLGAQSSK